MKSELIFLTIRNAQGNDAGLKPLSFCSIGIDYLLHDTMAVVLFNVHN